MNTFDQYEVWFVTGAQLLYGGDAVIAVDAHSNEMVAGLNDSGKLPVKVVYKGTANSSKEVEAVMKAANNDDKCIGIITWMHTFSPAKMWIHGLQQLKKPLLHLHTQFNKEIPWDTMDMDFMNLNQSAHGDREFGHICTRMRIRRKVVVGYWKDEETQRKIAVWMRVCAAWADAQDMLIIRFGDQMNNVAVTDGDKVEAEVRMGYHVDYCPVSELMEYHSQIKDEEVEALVRTYFNEYDHDAALEDKSTEAYQKVWNSAKAELALRAILKAKGAKGFTTNFDDLGQTDGSHFDQIPGLASQRLMADGYGFGAEGDWKSAAKEAAPGGSFPRHRRTQEPDSAPCVHVKDRRGMHSYRCRPWQPLPSDCQRRGMHRAETAAQTARRLCTLDSAAELRSGCRRMDPGRRNSPFVLLIRPDRRILGRLC